MTLTSDVTVARSGFAPLVQQIRAHGLLDRRRGRYAWLIGLDLLAYGAVWVAVALTGVSWWQAVLVLPAALFTTRLYFIGHDAGHGQIAATRRANRLLGLLVGNLGLGLSSAGGPTSTTGTTPTPTTRTRTRTSARASSSGPRTRRPAAGARSPAGSPATRAGCSFPCSSWRASTSR
ncbi:hypothetical protein Airi02_082870 [Actinoallomurus iriomotensis]|uniref:Fatty acid desaturase n=1 Tax=Actinoallomurus iriomotensis TaxID=478107 RepID=A0A9W6SB35_9ACTN|nr:hypothetical protein Airi02_082870 [Actinoallomurus iriomotensis]